jgi:hypothetical protein
MNEERVREITMGQTLLGVFIAINNLFHSSWVICGMGYS